MAPNWMTAQRPSLSAACLACDWAKKALRQASCMIRAGSTTASANSDWCSGPSTSSPTPAITAEAARVIATMKPKACRRAVRHGAPTLSLNRTLSTCPTSARPMPIINVKM